VQLLSINVGSKRTQPKGAELEITGIYKHRVEGPVPITALGLPGDFIGDARNHGGPDQAVYVYGTVDYEWWTGETGRRLAPGAFGENLTIDGLESAQLCIGDRLQIGDAILEVTAARIPCSTLSRRMADARFAAAFRSAERPGVYCRVITPGNVQAAEEVRLERFSGDSITVLEMFREHYRRDKDEVALRRLLSAPISIRARRSLQADLERLLSNPKA
jgi:MOSC domain-containing protein YiiM